MFFVKREWINHRQCGELKCTCKTIFIFSIKLYEKNKLSNYIDYCSYTLTDSCFHLLVDLSNIL